MTDTLSLLMRITNARADELAREKPNSCVLFACDVAERALIRSGHAKNFLMMSEPERDENARDR